MTMDKVTNSENVSDTSELAQPEKMISLKFYDITTTERCAQVNRVELLIFRHGNPKICTIMWRNPKKEQKIEEKFYIRRYNL